MQDDAVAAEGPIPADAGEPARRAVPAGAPRAYPRGRGGANAVRRYTPGCRGLSPRTRGSPQARTFRGAQAGPIPADAGEPGRRHAHRPHCRAYPRGRGGAAELMAAVVSGMGLSPRTRGSLEAVRLSHFWLGPIPADAGEPPSSPRSACPPRAYPRGRGGAIGQPVVIAFAQGLSPRTRGSRGGVTKIRPGVRPIPADAGEP